MVACRWQLVADICLRNVQPCLPRLHPRPPRRRGRRCVSTLPPVTPVGHPSPVPRSHIPKRQGCPSPQPTQVSRAALHVSGPPRPRLSLRSHGAEVAPFQSERAVCPSLGARTRMPPCSYRGTVTPYFFQTSPSTPRNSKISAPGPPSSASLDGASLPLPRPVFPPRPCTGTRPSTFRGVPRRCCGGGGAARGGGGQGRQRCAWEAAAAVRGENGVCS